VASGTGGEGGQGGDVTLLDNGGHGTDGT